MKMDSRVCAVPAHSIAGDMRDKVLEVIAEEVGHPVNEGDLLDDLGLDSLDFINLMMQLREKAGPIEDSQFPSFRTVADIVAFYA